MGAVCARRRSPRWAVAAAVAAFLGLVCGPVQGGGDGEEKDPESDPALKPPDVKAIDLQTMADGVDVSDETWDAVELDIPQQLEAGDARAVLRATKGRESIIAFALRPRTALLLHRETLRRVRLLHSKDPVGLNVLVARNNATAQLIDRLKSRTFDHECASAFGHLGYEVNRMLDGNLPNLDVVKAAVATLVKNDAKLHVSVAEWKEVILPALMVGRSLGNDGVTAWALSEVSRVVEGKDQDPEVRRLSVILELEKGTRLAATNPAEAAPLLHHAFAALAAPDAIAVTDETLLYYYNSAVTAAKLASIPIKADYRVRLVTGSILTCEIPLALGWSIDEAGGDQDLLLRRSGGLGRGSVTLETAIWHADTNYTQEDGRVLDGDSISMILKDRLQRLKPTLWKITKETPSVTKLSRTITPRSGWELLGQAKDGKPLRIREWAFKVGRASEQFLTLRVTETSARENDPELDRVLDTIAERAARK